jgi:shikimate kinase
VSHLTESDIAVKEAIGTRSIVLVGMMGAGKTSVGKRLAARLELPFVDADHEIEVAADRTVSEIFEEHGEAHFRDGERKVIARLLESGPQILATGGGAFISEETRDQISQKGISIWLNADFDTLMKRVRRRTTRPLLQQPDPEGIMKRLIEERYPVYAQADIEVMSQDGPHEQVVEDVVQALSQFVGLVAVRDREGSS